MKDLDELKELIEKTTFDLDIVKMEESKDLLNLTTAKCESELFLEIKLHQEVDISISVNLCYEDDSYPVIVNWKNYPNDQDSIVKILSNIISNTCIIGNSVGSSISKLDTTVLLAPSTSWVEVFKNELSCIFKDADVEKSDNIVVHLIGVDFIMKFDDDTSFFSVEMVQTISPYINKIVLRGVVCDNNYNNVLSTIRKSYNDAKRRYNNLETISLGIMWGR